MKKIAVLAFLVLLAACAPVAPAESQQFPTRDPIVAPAIVTPAPTRTIPPVRRDTPTVPDPSENKPGAETLPEGKPVPEHFGRAAGHLAESLGIPAKDVTVLSIEDRMFRNGCLELEKPGQMCTQQIVPGFVVTFAAGGKEYVYHVSENGANFGQAKAGGRPEVKPGLPVVVMWERGGGIAGVCERLTIFIDGSYTLVDCRMVATISAGNIPLEARTYLEEVYRSNAPFSWQFKPPAGSADMFVDMYQINGLGQGVPTDAEQEALNGYLSELVGMLKNQDAQQ